MTSKQTMLQMWQTEAQGIQLFLKDIQKKFKETTTKEGDSEGIEGNASINNDEYLMSNISSLNIHTPHDLSILDKIFALY